MDTQIVDTGTNGISFIYDASNDKVKTIIFSQEFSKYLVEFKDQMESYSYGLSLFNVAQKKGLIASITSIEFTDGTSNHIKAKVAPTIDVQDLAVSDEIFVQISVSAISNATSGTQMFSYNTNTFNKFTFPVSDNLVQYPTNYGPAGYASTSVDFGSSDFLSFLSSGLANHQAFTAPFDMTLKSNQSLGGYSGSYQGHGLRLCVGYYMPTYISASPFLIVNNPTVVLDKTYTPIQSNGYIDMLDDIDSSIVIPKGAVCLYTYAFLRPFAVSLYIKTQLLFEKIQ